MNLHCNNFTVSKKAKVAHKYGSYSQSLSWTLQHEITSISAPPGWDVSSSQGLGTPLHPSSIFPVPIIYSSWWKATLWFRSLLCKETTQ